MLPISKVHVLGCVLHQVEAVFQGGVNVHPISFMMAWTVGSMMRCALSRGCSRARTDFALCTNINIDMNMNMNMNINMNINVNVNVNININI